MLTILKASAGSGKTFALAYNYIKLLLGVKDHSGRYRLNPNPIRPHSSILAITFTNKATEEMKTRIIHELAVIAGMEPGWTDESPYLDKLTDEFGCTPENLRKSAGVVLRQLLFNFNFFNVSTIDSFFQIVLRTFAREAELTGNYEVDLDKKYAISIGVNEMFASLNRTDREKPNDSDNMRLKKWLVDFLDHNMRAGESFNIFNRNSQSHDALLNFIVGITDETFDRNSDSFEQYLSDPNRIISFAESIRQQIGRLRSRASKASKAVIQANESYNFGAKEGLSANARSLFAQWSTNGYVSDLGKTCDSIISNPEKSLYAATAKAAAAGKIDIGKLTELAAMAAVAIKESHSSVGILRETLGNMYVLGLLGRVLKHVADYRKQTSTLLLSDTNALLKKVIGYDTTPFIYERVGLWIRHFLIDEFQDTSELQWENLRPLIDESLSTDNDNLIIGDEKQCIYRFRNSEPALLANLDRMLPGMSNVEGNTPGANTNWRSSSDIIKFNNTFFKSLTSDDPHTGIYTNVVQNISPKHINHKGYVRLFPIDTDSDLTKAKYEGFARTAEEIRRQLDSGYKPGEIAVLFRKNKEGAEFISYLINLVNNDPTYPQLKIASDDSLFIARSAAVRLIISVMRLLSSSDYVSNEHNVSMREIAALFNRFENEKSRGATPSDALRKAIDTINSDPLPGPDITISVDTATLPALAKKIITTYLTEEQRRAENAYIIGFLDLVVDFSSRGANDLRSFIQWWDISGSRSTIATASDDNAIRVLTIHKSKGLEFRCVHLPFLDGRSVSGSLEWFIPSGLEFIDDPESIPPMLPFRCKKTLEATPYAAQYLEYARQAEIDNLNVIYVAFTRAIDELSIGYISGNGQQAHGSMIINKAIDRWGTVHDGFDSSLFTALSPDKNSPKILTVGQPTTARKLESKHKTALEPDSTIDVPFISTPAQKSDVWRHTSLEDNTSYIGNNIPAVAREIMRRSRDCTHIESTARSLSKSGIADENSVSEAARLIIKAITSHPEVSHWFENKNNVALNRLIDIGEGHTARMDRLVFNDDNSVEVIDFGRETDKQEKTIKRVNFYKSLLHRAGYTNVKGYIFDPAIDFIPKFI